jgi:hypothetical protein
MEKGGKYIKNTGQSMDYETNGMKAKNWKIEKRKAEKTMA